MENTCGNCKHFDHSPLPYNTCYGYCIAEFTAPICVSNNFVGTYSNKDAEGCPFYEKKEEPNDA